MYPKLILGTQKTIGVDLKIRRPIGLPKEEKIKFSVLICSLLLELIL